MAAPFPIMLFYIIILRIIALAWLQWLTPVIPAIQEAESRRIVGQS
jgi:hypothetical protein